MRYGWGTSSRNVLFFHIAIFGCQRVVGNPPKDTEVIYDISLVWLVGYVFSIFLGQIDGLNLNLRNNLSKNRVWQMICRSIARDRCKISPSRIVVDERLLKWDPL